ncbi:GPI biosynthesis protein family Pig-F-domain-containing protein [Chaetomium tenue]|uniref:GPI biosynthesis protein family Pig-F-domain-containing protein n=1 Tax=Chaetomium tenue TaxID=1854479 RepID=A0ACB7PEK9_9PEZI|nr:GPI biosynthesis protein family Pig-F-domain-containing protein [Chaetomium globosum]
MPLVEPITMSTTLAKGAAAQAQAQAAFSKTAPVFPATTLRPVQIRSTPLAQTARHALPALLAVLFGARFRALVADPVSAMATALPLVAALQVTYAVLCLPAPGSTQGGGGGARKAQKPRPGESIKRRSADAGAPNAVATSLLSLVLSLLVSPFLYAAMILFGAPFLTHSAHTFLCAAHLAVLALFPLFFVHGVDGSAWAVVGSFGAPLDETFGGLLGGVVGAWLGAVPIPLDWDREWQRWPVTILCGLYGGYILGRVVGGTLVWGKSF